MSIDRRKFLQLTSAAGFSLAALNTTIGKALAIPAHNRKRTIKDVEHIVILTQENRPFDHHFGTIFGVRGFNDPRAVKINLPLKTGGSKQVSVFLQPAGAANEAAGFLVPPNSRKPGGPAKGGGRLPPFPPNPTTLPPAP